MTFSFFWKSCRNFFGTPVKKKKKSIFLILPAEWRSYLPTFGFRIRRFYEYRFEVQKYFFLRYGYDLRGGKNREKKIPYPYRLSRFGPALPGLFNKNIIFKKKQNRKCYEIFLKKLKKERSKMKWNFYFIVCASFLFIYSVNCQSIENVDGNLKFLIAEGKRIGIVGTVLHSTVVSLTVTLHCYYYFIYYHF